MYSGGINRNTVWARKSSDLARVTSQAPRLEPVTSQLMQVVSSTVISATNFRWKYTLRRAQVGVAGSYVPALTADTQTETGLSVSELSNATGFGWVSYGITRTLIPAGFAPVAIPNGTYVMTVPHRISDGTLVWLIINTQAIDGACP